MVLDSVRADAVIGGSLLLAMRRALRWQAAMDLLNAEGNGALEVVEAAEACFGAQQPLAFQNFSKLMWRLASWRPRTMLSGRSAGLGEAAVLHDLLRSCQGGLAKAFAWHAAKALPAQLGVLPPLAAKDAAERERHGAVVESADSFFHSVEMVPRARTLAVWLSFHLWMGCDQLTGPASVQIGNKGSGEWIVASGPPASKSRSVAPSAKQPLFLDVAEANKHGGWSEVGDELVARASKRSRTGGAGGAGGAAGRSRHSRGISAGTGSVCKLFVKRVPCNFADPWRKHSQQSSTGTGFLLDDRFVVTNAHVVHRAVSVLVRATVGPPVKWNARVVAVGLPCDLAILAVEDEFWKGKESLSLSRDIPKLDDNVTCIGFPVGGENISVTRGVVSRIDVNMDGLLRIQIDAAINPGNSGGPVLGSHGRVVGVAASHLKNASNIGYIIPTQVLEQFILCAGVPTEGGCEATGKGYLGVSSLGVGRVQTLESHPLRRMLGLPEGCTAGVRVAKVWPLGSSSGKLEEDDVLLEIDGVEISQDGTVPLRDNERIHFQHLVTKRNAGQESVHLKVWRQKSEHEVDISLRPDRWLVPRMDGYDAAAEYTIVGGLVFIPLSHPWADLKCNDKHFNQARALIHQFFGQAMTEEGQQVIILSKVLAHPCNSGYHGLGNIVLHSFAGQTMRNVAELARAVARCDQQQLVFNFLRPNGDGKELVVLDRADCQTAEAEILAQHLIGSPCMVRVDGRGEPRPLDPEASEGNTAT
ncbi:DEGP10 [Symbiodinium pilosum]|uniref:DEGP10 protein n=1 Tax=Symbiodinium pilosum TaxID=2952 RepID=A0A812VIB4_SYMPI|nr:DEGP10 [Symbiodinium pilosum]